MSTPSWYGSIGVMHARHLRRRRGIGAWMAGALSKSFGEFGVWRERPRRRRLAAEGSAQHAAELAAHGHSEAIRSK